MRSGARTLMRGAGWRTAEMMTLLGIVLAVAVVIGVIYHIGKGFGPD